MATLRVGSFEDNGTLPPHVVRRCGYGGLVATVAQGQPALELWSRLACTQGMRKEKVKLTLGSGLKRMSGGTTAPALVCQVVAGGAGFKGGPATCHGNSQMCKEEARTWEPMDTTPIRR